MCLMNIENRLRICGRTASLKNGITLYQSLRMGVDHCLDRKSDSVVEDHQISVYSADSNSELLVNVCDVRYNMITTDKVVIF